MDNEKFSKVVNETILNIMNSDPEIVGEIADELFEVMPEDDRKFDDSEFNEYMEHVAKLVHKIVSISVSASYLLPSSLKVSELEEEDEKLQKRISELENKEPHLKVLKNPDLSESAKDSENRTPEN